MKFQFSEISPEFAPDAQPNFPFSFVFSICIEMTVTFSRRDVLDAKADLAAVLGTQKDAYWSCIRQFIAGEITRRQFDAEAQSLLGRNGLSPNIVK
jgi:hypothetical protein